MEVDPDANLSTATDDSIVKTYIYAHGQVLAQHDIDEGTSQDDLYFYLHDRLGSVRSLFDTAGTVQNYYSYNPFGEILGTEIEENVTNPFMFTGQYFDSEIKEYYLRARQYNPHISIFTTQDPVFGKLRTPMSLHPYLYCMNDPANRTDPSGEKSLAELKATMAASATAFGGAVYDFGSKVMGLARSVYYSAMVRAADINMWMGRYIYGYGGQSKSTAPYTPGQLKHYQRILQKDGLKSLLDAKGSLAENLLQHTDKLPELEYQSSVLRTIGRMQGDLAAIEHILENASEYIKGG